MANGYAGKIARLNPSTKAITTIDTDKYEKFVKSGTLLVI
jgi:hypothetical protein